MYPVVDVYFLLELTELPDNETKRSAEEQSSADDEVEHS